MNPLIFAAVVFLQAPFPAPVAASETPTLTGARTAMYTAAALDIGSTLYALDRGGREANPILGTHPRAARVIGLKAAGVLLNDLAAQYWLRKGKVGRAKFIYWFAAGVWFAASAWNFQIIGG